MFRIVLCLAVLVAVQAMSTTMMPMASTTKHNNHHNHHNHTHQTHAPTEATEKDAFRFIYEGHTHQMLLINQHACYIFTLSDSERTAVHTDAGLRSLELKLVNMLSTGTSTEVQMQDQPKQIQHACGAHSQHVYTVM